MGIKEQLITSVCRLTDIYTGNHKERQNGSVRSGGRRDDTVETAGRAAYGSSFRHTMLMKMLEFNPCLVCSGNKQLL